MSISIFAVGNYPLDEVTRTEGLSIAAMERQTAAEDDARPPPSARQLSVEARVAELHEQLAELREAERRSAELGEERDELREQVLEAAEEREDLRRLRRRNRLALGARVLEQREAAGAETRRVSEVLCVFRSLEIVHIDARRKLNYDCNL